MKKIIRVLNNSADLIEQKQKREIKDKRAQYARRVEPLRHYDTFYTESDNFSTIQESVTVNSSKESSPLPSLERSRSALKRQPTLKSSKSVSLMKRKGSRFTIKNIGIALRKDTARRVKEKGRELQKQLISKEIAKDVTEWNRVASDKV